MKNSLSGLKLRLKVNLMSMRYLLIACVTILGFTSCKKDGCNVKSAFNYDPDGDSDENCVYEPLEMRMEVKPYFGDQELDTDSEYTTADGRKISFEYLGIYISEIRLTQGNTSIAPDRDIMLVTADDYSFETRAFPQGEIDGVTFTVGVDSTVYYIDPATYEESHPLAPKVPTMYWSWATGYRYISLNGKVDTSMAGDDDASGNFTYHTGLDVNLRSFELGQRAVNINNRVINLKLKVDVSAILENIDFTTELVTHTMNDPVLAAKITQNAENAFTIQ